MALRVKVELNKTGRIEYVLFDDQTKDEFIRDHNFMRVVELKRETERSLAREKKK